MNNIEILQQYVKTINDYKSIQNGKIYRVLNDYAEFFEKPENHERYVVFIEKEYPKDYYIMQMLQFSKKFESAYNDEKKKILEIFAVNKLQINGR